MTSKRKIKDVFYNIFVGEFVQIVTEVQTKTVQQSEEEIKESNHPVILEGYLLDVDDDFYYLGDTPNSISSGVKKTKIVHIQIAEPKSYMDDILDEMPMPENEDEIN